MGSSSKQQVRWCGYCRLRTKGVLKEFRRKGERKFLCLLCNRTSHFSTDFGRVGK